MAVAIALIELNELKAKLAEAEKKGSYIFVSFQTR